MVVTYILRLLIDSGRPEGVRGTLQRIPARQTVPFADLQELLALLERSSAYDPSGTDLPGVMLSPEKADDQTDE